MQVSAWKWGIGLFLCLPVCKVQAQFKAAPPVIQTNSLLLLQQQSAHPPVLPAGTSSNWYKKATEQIEQREYTIKKLTDNTVYGVVNRAQQLGARITAEGYTLKRVDFNQGMNSLWQADFSIKGVDRGNNTGYL